MGNEQSQASPRPDEAAATALGNTNIRTRNLFGNIINSAGIVVRHQISPRRLILTFSRNLTRLTIVCALHSSVMHFAIFKYQICRQFHGNKWKNW
ncbi:hypothetical protein M378DRAFT_1001174 [Amanita muscaria Koide BX008]|uniref:Uncharacterized protein n=1 Tax=Amanita muscaria (strain Koide BX008) TaxID=946122 RepID=A0A0C2S9X4_AMAMK|nr:hypothetical protein M378DRAFT_1001174 [Amanita muscaria Koide BX008]